MQEIIKENNSEEYKAFLSYTNESEEIINGFVTITSLKEGLLTFKTKSNLVMIPTSRIIKLKRGLE